MEGDHFHLVADLTHLMNEVNTEMSICNLSIFGTQYIRDGQPLPGKIDLFRGDNYSLLVKHIKSKLLIGTKLSINLRQATSLQFVHLKELSGETQVLIDAAELEEGEYELILESFNTLSLTKSALKIDTVQISVMPEQEVIKVHELKRKVLTPRTPETWNLRNFIPNILSLTLVEFKIKTNLEAAI